MFIIIKWRSCFTGILVSSCLATLCFSGVCAETNNQNDVKAALTASDDRGSNQLALAQLQNTNDLKSNSARVLSPNDVIAVTVYQEDDLTTKTIIDKNGMVMLPLLGQVPIGGMTIGEATERIRWLYNKDYLVNPQVNLIVEHFAERRFSVLGQVQHPGNFDFPQNESVNLLEAIAISGGYTRLGAPSKVDVRRIENGTSKIYHLDANEMSRDLNKKPFVILPDDIINVGERTF
jgi:polysaccharide export outer membrane protein